MSNTTTISNWTAWQRFFSSRSKRPLPALDLRTDYSALPRSLGRSLAVFQLGESGGGTVVRQAAESRLPGVGADYAEAMRLFVEEEHRHANILAMSVRLLGGELIRKNWTARLFVMFRRLIGLRFKVLVLLAAEVVGICYYAAIAGQLGGGPVQRWLLELVSDERAHLRFHCDFLRSQTPTRWQRYSFVALWRVVSHCAAIAVMIDHRHAIRDTDLNYRVLWQRFMAVSQQAEKLVTEPRESLSKMFWSELDARASS